MATNLGELVSLGLDRRRGRSLGRQLYHLLRSKILAGELAPGTRLLSSRNLALELNISRNTIAEALGQLVAEGYLEARAGAGTFVSNMLLQPGSAAPAGVAALPETRPETLLSMRGRDVLRHAFAPRSRHPAFTPGLPSIDGFPAKAWARCVAAVSRSTHHQLAEHEDPRGNARLRAVLAAYLRAARNVRCGNDQVFIVSGAQDGVDLLCRAILAPADQAIVEEPGYSGLKSVLASWGIVIRPGPVDGEGLVVPADSADWSGTRLICATPCHQFPLGMSMSPARRFSLLAAARAVDAWILEDDYDSEYRHLGNPLPALQGLDGGERVIHLGSFSKMLFPALRLAYLVVPRGLVEPLCRVRAATGGHAAAATQLALARFMELGHFTRHLRKMRRHYSLRRARFVELIEDNLSAWLKVSNSECGQHVIVELHEDTRRQADDRAVASAAGTLGLTLVPLSVFYEGAPRKHGFVLGFGALSDQDMLKSVARLRQLLLTFGP